MNQCVPSWDIDDPPNPSSLLINQYLSAAAHVSMPENEVAELKWENGHLSVHGLTHPRISKPTPKYPSPSPASAWDKLRPSGTLESVVDQATRAQLIPNSPVLHPDLAAWLSAQHHHVPPNPSAVDAVVPCSSRSHSKPRPDPVADPASGIVASSGGGSVRKRARVLEASQVSAGPTGGGRGESTRVTLDTCDDVGFTTASASLSLRDGEGGGSPDTENASFGGGRPPTVDEHDSVGHSRRFQRDRARDDEEKASKEETGRSIVFAKRSRAAIHNQSERKRRDRINQRMRTLQKLVPNSSKTDKASMLDEVIEYVKQLQAQVQMMARMGSIPPMMMPMSMQQLQMSMMAQMAHMAQMAQMGIGLGMVDLSALSRAGNPGIASVLHPSGMPPVFSPAAFLPVTGTPGDASFERMQPSSGTMFPDPFSPMLACPPQQPMVMDVYNRMIALYKQLNQPNAGTNPNG